MNWETQLKQMSGKTFRRNGEPETIHKYVCNPSGLVEVLTDVDDYELQPGQVSAFLATFRPLTVPARRTAQAGVAVGPVSDTAKLQVLQNALLTAIERVQDDASYVPQADQVSRLVQTGINLAKLELEAIRLSKA